MTRYREIEIKIVVENACLPHVVAQLLCIYPEMYHIDTGESTDTYWHLPESSKSDFLRLRKLDGRLELTTKRTDRGSNLNRQEINLEITSGVTVTRRLIQSILGTAAGTVTKEYEVYGLPGSEAVISAYVVSSDPKNVIIEVESGSESEVLEHGLKLEAYLAEKKYVIRRENRSLYEMYIQEKK